MKQHKSGMRTTALCSLIFSWSVPKLPWVVGTNSLAFADKHKICLTVTHNCSGRTIISNNPLFNFLYFFTVTVTPSSVIISQSWAVSLILIVENQQYTCSWWGISCPQLKFIQYFSDCSHMQLFRAYQLTSTGTDSCQWMKQLHRHLLELRR